jgi:ATP-dependent DNA helicase RecG
VASEPITREIETRLLNQGLLARHKGKVRPTGWGMLLFGEHPRDRFPQAGLIATADYGDGETETADFSGPLIEVPDAVGQWLRPRLPRLATISGMRRVEREEIPSVLIREAIVNALVHRDYGLSSAKCQLRLAPSRIEVMSPGAPVSPITLEQLQRFEAPMLSRNPKLHYAFRLAGLAEEAGWGMKAMRRTNVDPTAAIVRYAFDDPYLMLTLTRSAQGAAAQLLDEPTAQSLTEGELAGWEYLLRNGPTTRLEYAEALAVSPRTALRQLSRLTQLELVVRKGAGRGTSYEASGRAH